MNSNATIESADRVLTARQIADRYQVNRQTVWAWGRRGRLPVLRLGALRRFKESDLVKFMSENPKAGAKRSKE